MLLSEGIGDTIRISLASDPVDEIKVGWDILKSLNLRSRGVKIIACPSCSRQNFNVIEVVNELINYLDNIKILPRATWASNYFYTSTSEIKTFENIPSNLNFINWI